MKPIVLDDEYSYAVHTTGFATTLPAEPEPQDPVEQLRRCVEECTGSKVERPRPVTFGFIPTAV